MKQAKPEEILQRERKRKGFSQEEFANEIQLSQRMYQRYEEGKFPKYKSDKVKSIDKKLGTNLYELIYEQNVPREIKIASDLATEVGQIQSDLILLKATARIIGMNVAELMASKEGVSMAKAALDLEKTISQEADRLYAELNKQKG